MKKLAAVKNDYDYIDISVKCLHKLLDKKAEDPVFLDLRKVNSYLSYFLIITGNSQIHCRSLAREAISFMSDHGISSFGKPDYSTEWIALDMGDLVIHVFTEETRELYGLEKLWADADRVQF